MNKVIIVTDSSAYLPQTIVDQYQIPVLPLILTWQGKQYRDGVDITAKEFYTQLSQSKEMATTSQVTVGQFLDIFKPLLDAGNQVFLYRHIYWHFSLVRLSTNGKRGTG